MTINKNTFVAFVEKTLGENAERLLSETNILCRGCAYEQYDDGSLEAWEYEDGYQMFSGSDLYYERRVRIWPDGHWEIYESTGNGHLIVHYQGGEEVSRE